MTKKLTGTEPYQTPLNADLGTMAYLDSDWLPNLRIAGIDVESGGTQSGIYFKTNDPTHYTWRLINEGNVNRLRMTGSGDGLTTVIPFYALGDSDGAMAFPQGVMIGTSSAPTATLDVVGTNATEQLRVGNSTGGTDFGITVSENSGVTLNSAEGTTARNMIFAIGGTAKVEIGADGYVNKFVLYGKSDYSNTYTYTQGGFGSLYTTLIPPGNLSSNSIYLITIKTVFEASPYYADTSFIFTTCPGTNGAGAGSPKDFLTSNHVTSANVYWSIRTTTGVSSTNGIQGLCNNAPVAGGGVPTVKVYAQKIGFVS